MATIVTINTVRAPNKIVSFIPTAPGRPVELLTAAADPRTAPELYPRQHWRLEMRAVPADASSYFWACSFTMAILGKPLQAITFNALGQPLLVADYDSLNSKQWWFMQEFHSDGSVVLGQNIATSSASCMDLSGGNTEDGTPIQSYQYIPNNVNQFWQIKNATEVSAGIRFDLAKIVQTIFDTARGNETFVSILHSDPAPVFVAAGYPLHENDYDSFNKFFINLFKEQGMVLAREPFAVDSDWLSCTMCKTALYSLVLGVAVLAGGGLAMIHEGAAPVILLAAAIGVSARFMSGMLIALGATIVQDVISLATQLCDWVGACKPKKNPSM